MKITKFILCAAVAGAMALIANKAAAEAQSVSGSLPLKLMSVSGTAYVTPYYGNTAATTASQYATVSFNYNTVMQVITHQVYLNSGKIVPPNAYVVFDPISYQRYLTNSVGFYYNLNNIVYVYFYDIATSFKGDFYAGSENDVAGVELEIYGRGPDGSYYEFDIYGTGKLTASYGGKAVAVYTKTSTVSMTVSTTQSATGYAEIQDSDEGVIGNGQFTFSGSGTVSSSIFPFSSYWYYNED
jgi:hypothetical protein